MCCNHTTGPCTKTSTGARLSFAPQHGTMAYQKWRISRGQCLKKKKPNASGIPLRGVEVRRCRVQDILHKNDKSEPVPHEEDSVRITTKWSGRRGSNPLPPPWQGGALPDELRPQNIAYYSRQAIFCQELFFYFSGRLIHLSGKNDPSGTIGKTGTEILHIYLTLCP